MDCGHLGNRHYDDVGRDYLDDMDLQQPPDEELQFVEVLKKLQQKHS